MKTRFQFLLWLFAIVPLAFISCGDDETIIEDTTLETSVASVTFTKDGGDQSITITTNAAKWIASSPVEGAWLTLSANGDQLSVKAAANKEGVDRKSYILINAGNTAAKVEVMQSAGDAALFLTPETLSFTKAAAEQRVDVIGATGFTVEAEAAAAEWLSVNYQPGADFFMVAVTEYDGAEPRTGKVIVTAGTVVKEVTVTQGAGAAEAFILPYLGSPSNYATVFNYELARGHALSNIPQIFGNSYYEFATGNADCPLLGYWYNVAAQDATYAQGAALYTNSALFTEDEGAAFKAFMESKGFTYNEGLQAFVNEEVPYVVDWQLSDGVVQVNAIYQPKQKEPQPTFSKLPVSDRYDFMHCAEAGYHGYTLEQIATWEGENGGTYSEEESSPENDYTAYIVENGAEGLAIHGYWDETEVADFIGEIMASQDVCTDLTRVYYTDEGTGNMYETTEWLKLLADNGFTFLGNSSDGLFSFYGNNEIQLGYAIADASTMLFQAMRLAAPAPAVKDILLNSEVRAKYLQEVRDRFAKLNDGRIVVPFK